MHGLMNDQGDTREIHVLGGLGGCFPGLRDAHSEATRIWRPEVLSSLLGGAPVE